MLSRSRHSIGAIHICFNFVLDKIYYYLLTFSITANNKKATTPRPIGSNIVESNDPNILVNQEVVSGSLEGGSTTSGGGPSTVTALSPPTLPSMALGGSVGGRGGSDVV
jgi:hypothetical protein